MKKFSIVSEKILIVSEKFSCERKNFDCEKILVVSEKFSCESKTSS